MPCFSVVLPRQASTFNDSQLTRIFSNSRGLREIKRYAIPGIKGTLSFSTFLDHENDTILSNSFYQDGENWLACDAVLFNEDEVRDELNLENVLLAGKAEVLYKSYCRWGNEFANHFNGEFVFAIWNAASRTLLCGRDQLGRRLLYWRLQDNLAVFSTILDPIRSVPGISIEPDIEALAEVYAGFPRKPSATFYNNIKQLEPASLLWIDHHHSVKQSRYSVFKKSAALNHEPVDRFLEIYKKAVAQRLGATGNVGCLLSGGLDSSSIAKLASAELASRSNALLAYTAVPPSENPIAASNNRINDETKYVELLKKHALNICGQYISSAGDSLVDGWDCEFEKLGTPVRNPENYGWMMRAVRLMQTAKKSGRSNGILLNGYMGNFTVSYPGPFFALEYLEAFDYLGLLKELWARNREMQLGYWSQLKGHFLAPMFSSGWTKTIGSLKGNNHVSAAVDVLNPDIVRRCELNARGRPSFWYTGFDSALGSKERHATLIQNYLTSGTEYDHMIRTHHGVHMFDPTADLNVVNFCLQVPDRVYQQKGKTRLLIREAMKNSLPDELRLRTDYGVPSADWFLRMTSEKDKMQLRMSEFQKNDWINELFDLKEMRFLFERWPSKIDVGTENYSAYKYKLLRGFHFAQFVNWVTH